MLSRHDEEHQTGVAQRRAQLAGHLETAREAVAPEVHRVLTGLPERARRLLAAGPQDYRIAGARQVQGERGPPGSRSQDGRFPRPPGPPRAAVPAVDGHVGSPAPMRCSVPRRRRVILARCRAITRTPTTAAATVTARSALKR